MMWEYDTVGARIFWFLTPNFTPVRPSNWRLTGHFLDNFNLF